MKTVRRRTPRAPTLRPETPVRLEVDLRHERLSHPDGGILGKIEALLREQNIEEQESLIGSTAELLHALSSVGYSRVDHWEVDPGGWLPLPEETHPGIIEPVGHLLRALSSDSWRPLATARRFSVRLSAGDGRRADVVVRRVHRERDHSVSLELWGHSGKPELRRLVRALEERLSVLRVQVHG